MHNSTKRRVGPLTIMLTTPRYDFQKGFMLKLIWRRGAGYKGGRTAYIGAGIVGGTGCAYTPRIGAGWFTRNAHKVPYFKGFARRNA